MDKHFDFFKTNGFTFLFESTCNCMERLMFVHTFTMFMYYNHKHFSIFN